MLRDRLNDELKEAMRKRDSRCVATIRLILAAIKDRDISLRGEGKDNVDDQGIHEILQKMIKQRRDSIEAFEKGERPELAKQEHQEIEIISSFLPPQLNDSEIEQVCRDAITELDAASLKDIGRVMGHLKEKFAGQMDFAKASARIREILS